MEYKFTEKNFNSEVMESSLPVVVDFYADWCMPCKMMMPVVEEMAKRYDGKVKIGKLNVDEESAIASEFGVMSIPSFFFIKDGKVVSSSVGGMRADALAANIDSLLEA